jgi:hypothetical protein
MGWIVVFLLTVFISAACAAEQTSLSDPEQSEGDQAAQETERGQNEARQDKAEQPKTYSFGTGAVGSGLNAMGNGLASVISTYSSVQMDVKPFAGVNAYANLVDQGKDVHFAATTGPELAWLYRGEAGYEHAKNMRLLVRGNYLISTGIVVRQDAGVNQVADLKGKRVVQYGASPISSRVVEATLAANGLAWDDVTPVPVAGGLDGIAALRDGLADGAYAYAPGTPLVEETHNAVGLKAIHAVDNMTANQFDQIPQEVIDVFNRYVPGSRMTIAQPESFITQETISIEFPNVVGVSAHVPDQVVYEIISTLWQHYEELHSTHVWFHSWNPEQMFDPRPTVPYHPGAVQFFKDQGLWTKPHLSFFKRLARTFQLYLVDHPGFGHSELP